MNETHSLSTNKPTATLIVGPSWVGDMVMAASLFRLLKQQQPDVAIDVLAPAWTFSVLERMPEVREAIAVPIAHGELGLAKRFRLAQQLKSQHYSQAIVLPNSWKSALIPWLAGIPKRTGWVGECRYGLLNDARKLDKQRYPLMIEQFMALGLEKVAAIPQPYLHPKLHVQADNQTKALAKFNPRYGNKPILALGPGAEFGPAKRWPAAHFAALANHYLDRDWHVWLFGSPKDTPITEEVMQLTQYRCDHLAGRCELYETIDLLSLVDGVVSNDSGLMHLAAALEKPVIAIYGPTSPAFTPPLSAEAQILQLNLPCQPCFQRECPLQHHRCMREITPAQVIAAMQDWAITA